MNLKDELLSEYTDCLFSLPLTREDSVIENDMVHKIPGYFRNAVDADTRDALVMKLMMNMKSAPPKKIKFIKLTKAIETAKQWRFLLAVLITKMEYPGGSNGN